MISEGNMCFLFILKKFHSCEGVPYFAGKYLVETYILGMLKAKLNDNNN